MESANDKSRLRPSFNKSIEIDIPITCSGAFAYYVTYTPLPDFSTQVVPSPVPTRSQLYYLDVSPRLTLQKAFISINSLSICSVLSKLMGKTLTDWDKHLAGIGRRSYNMVHFTPLTQRGSSNSPYSIYDQLTFDTTAFPNGESDVELLVSRMENEFGLLGMTDVVWNHTANNSKWLEEHPEAGYNLDTAPWLQAAEEMDHQLLDYGSKLQSHGLPNSISTLSDLDRIVEGIKSQVINSIELWQYYILDVERDSSAAVAAWREGNVTLPAGGSTAIGGVMKTASLKEQADWLVNWALVGNDRLGERFRRKIQPEIAGTLLTNLFGSFSRFPNESAASSAMHAILDEINLNFYREYDEDRSAIIEQLYNRIKYQRWDDHGPNLGPISESSPIIESYFTRLPVNEVTKKHNLRSLALVNNGWIWAADAMKDNAGSSSRAYLRREVISWGDCVKLRYGSGPSDSPFLWDYIAKYTKLMAKYFTGFRVDNCHSTPIHVAEFMLDQARRVRPNLLVCAELFSGSRDTDFYFVQRLGISALIREAMQAGSTAEMSRLVHMHGGIPIGSFMLDEVANADQDNIPSSHAPNVTHKIRPSDVHALFFDCTHDNEPPAQKRDARDALPNSGLVAFCSCAAGSVMGYDEMYPALIDLVSEARIYTSVSSEGPLTDVVGKGGVAGIKRLLNRIHVKMGQEGYEETYIDHREQYITVHRINPATRHGYFLIAHTAYPGYQDSTGHFDPVHLAGTKSTPLGSWMLQVDASDQAKSQIANDKWFLRGLPAKTFDLHSVQVENRADESVISIDGSFPPGSIAVFETSIPTAEHADGLNKHVTTGARTAFKDLKLRDLNFVLYRSDPEERDTSSGRDGVYSIPNFGPLVYAGLQGWWSVLRDVIRNNDLGHPICQHLRDGPWAMEYIVNRLQHISGIEGYERIKDVATWFEQRFNSVKRLPNTLWPRYFAMVLQTAYGAARDRAIGQMSQVVQNGPTFLKNLALVSVQMSGYMNSASLYPRRCIPSLAAGLPHFAFDWARCWGRDVFISLRGLLLGTGRFINAREHILAFASVLKHGMIPNLLGSAKNPRYNSRDSVWFFLQNIQDFTEMAPNGMLLLKDSIKRRFLPYDDTWFPWDDPRAYSTGSTVEDVIQEVLQRHASGMSFREANAGPTIDSQMKDQGFELDIHVDWTTGLIFGGNQFNCGTWMDKMGESEKAGNKGIPGSPRDGASVEITGLVYSTLLWVSHLHERGQYKYEGVSISSSGGSITFKDWAAKIKANFERCYWIPLDPRDDALYDVNSKIVNRRGIYKDLYRSGKEYEDYQLRPNFPIAMTIAPDLFNPQRALHAIAVADSALRGPYGMATLDPSDFNYHPNYINSDDSTDFATAKGRNYHSGPEWLWPLGFLCRAMMHFDLKRRKSHEERLETYQQVTKRLEGCMKMVHDSTWAGLTELTNYNGSFCGDSVSDFVIDRGSDSLGG